MLLQTILVRLLLPALVHNPVFQSNLPSTDKLGQIVIKNPVVFSTDQVKRIAGIKPRQTVNSAIIEKAVERIKTAYFRLGYIEIKVSIEMEVSPRQIAERNQFVDLQITLDEGLAFYIRRTEVYGGDTTNHHVVMHAVGDLRPEQLYNPELAEKWVIGLNRLGRFERVKKEDIEIRIDKQEHFVDVLFHVKEKPGLK